MSRSFDPAVPRPLTFRGADGIRLRVDARGDANAPLVLFLHGGGQTRHAWGGPDAALARDGRCAIALDLRGNGESDWASDEAPYRLVRGRESDILSDDGVREFLAQLPSAEYVGGAGHMVAGDRNDAFTEAVRGFLTPVAPL